MREAFIERSFKASSLATIEQANTILAEYEAQGFKLTLRQLYYQFVARDLLPNTLRSYKNLGGIVSDGRLAGLIDWESIEDRLREVEHVNTWDDPESIIGAVAKQYRRDVWQGQTQRCEVWIEKDALVGVIEPTCRKWRVPWFACRGYVSQSAQYEAAKRFREHLANGLAVTVFHLGDHDPSGLDMTRENQAKMDLMLSGDAYAFDMGGVVFERLALNRDQITRYRPPPNPAKDTDARFAEYRRQHGTSSWELDALQPSVIAELIDDAISLLVDENEWDQQIQVEEAELQELAAVRDHWNEAAQAAIDARRASE